MQTVTFPDGKVVDFDLTVADIIAVENEVGPVMIVKPGVTPFRLNEIVVLQSLAKHGCNDKTVLPLISGMSLPEFNKTFVDAISQSMLGTEALEKAAEAMEKMQAAKDAKVDM